MIPNEHSYCELDPERGRRVGHPGAALSLEVVGPRDRARRRTCSKTFADVITAMGGKVDLDASRPTAPRPSPPAARSSTRWARCAWATTPGPACSTAGRRAHEVKNLYVADGAAFVSNADKNPTLTILALAWRASDHLMGEMKRRNI